jgi:hypothetical protein
VTFNSTRAAAVTAKGDKEPVAFSAPDRETDWVLVLRAKQGQADFLNLLHRLGPEVSSGFDRQPQ